MKMKGDTAIIKKKHDARRYENNREGILKKIGEYQRINRKDINKKRKERYLRNRDKELLAEKKYRKENPQKIKNQKRKYYFNNKIKIKEYNEEYRKVNHTKIRQREKESASRNLKQIKVRNKARAIKILEGQMCEICKKKKATQRHHEDYNQPLKIIFVCSICHGIIHRKDSKRGLRTTVFELRLLADELEAQIELDNLKGIPTPKDIKFQINIINKEPNCSDTWEIEDSEQEKAE